VYKCNPKDSVISRALTKSDRSAVSSFYDRSRATNMRRINMHHISIDGKDIVVDDEYYLSAIRQLAKGYFILAEAYHNYHMSGFADWKGSLQMPDIGQNEVIKALVGQIDDVELFKAVNSLQKLLKMLQEIDKRISNWLAKFAGVSSLREKKDIVRLERQLKKIIVNGPDGHPEGPVWVLLPEYQVFVDGSRNILSEMEKVQQQAEKRIEQLLEPIRK